VTNVRVGVVGPGYIGARHLEAWRHVGVRLHAYTRSAARRAEVGAAFPEVCWHSSLGQLVAAVDVVDVCTPTDAHAAVTLAAAAQGRHVVCEKPIARTLAEADRMIEACDQAGVQLHVGHVVRYQGPYAAAHDAVRDGEVGRPTRLRMLRGGATPTWSSWFVDPRRSGGVLVDLAIHDIDFARWVAGEVVAVAAAMPEPGTAQVQLTHDGGAVSQVTAVWGPAGSALRTEFEIVGTDGSVAHDSTTDGAARDADPLVEMLGEFRAAIRGGPPPRVSAADARAALVVALRAAGQVG
jgi:myo-inositol 2-dehydrogenase / D-chiro-inositol 1-dehydrogenase